MPKNHLDHLNERAGTAKYKADELLRTLALKKGSLIADVGAGSGFFTYAFARATGQKGKVIAVDINEDSLAFIKQKAVEMGLQNVDTFQTTEEKLLLPQEKFDLIFSRNMVHHLPDPLRYFESITEYMKKNARAVIIDYKKPARFSFSFSSFFHHYSDPLTITEAMKSAGLYLDSTFDFLPNQSFQIFKLV